MGKVMKCNCVHSFQDSVYGAGQRLHVRCQKDAKYLGDKCTVCGVLKQPEAEKKVKK